MSEVLLQVRFWDMATGEEVRQVGAADFTFSPGADMSQRQTSRHQLTARGDTLLLTDRLPGMGGP